MFFVYGDKVYWGKIQLKYRYEEISIKIFLNVINFNIKLYVS